MRHVRTISAPLTLAIALLAGASSTSLAWHGPGHMATAVIAYHELGPKRAHTVAMILRSLPDYAEWMRYRPASIPEDEYAFMRASIWPDQIRAKNSPEHELDQPTWHYVNRFLKYPPTLRDPKPDGEVHIVEAEARNLGIVAHPDPNLDPLIRAMALCWVFHLMGDAHQPLHTVSLVTKQWPYGDRGGNSFWVTTSDGPMPLHTFWDGLWDRATAYDASQSKPRLNERDVDPVKVDALARRIRSEYARAKLPELATTRSFENVIDESASIARSIAYMDDKLRGADSYGSQPPPNPPALPNGYEQRALTVGDRRLALGGYRLADTLSHALGLPSR